MRLRLHPTQSRVFRNRKRFRVLVAGRRWGKTWQAKAELARGVQEAGVGPWRFWYVAPTYREARDIFWGDCKAFFAPWVRTTPNESRLELDLVTGAQIALKGADNPDSLRGRGVKGCVLDEFATMKGETWTEVIRPALSDQEGWALFIGTPQSYNHFHALYERGQSRDEKDHAWASWQFRTLEGAVQPWGPMKVAEIEAAKADLDPRTFRQEYEASFESLSGRVYYAFSRERNVASVQIQPDDTACVAFDFNIDPATAVIGCERGDGVLVWREVYLTHLGGEATLSVAQRVKALLAQVGHYGPLRIYGDSTGKSGKTTGPSDHAVLRAEFPSGEWRIPREQPHVKDRLASVNSLCQSATGRVRLTVDPSCQHLIADLEQVRFNERGEVEKDENKALTHVSDALGYWLVRDFPVVPRPVTLGGMRFDYEG